MEKVVIVTDSAASIPEAIVKELGIFVVPIGIQIDGQFYRENVDISREEFYHSLDRSGSMTTSQPSPGDFMEIYKEAGGRGSKILSLHITGRSSGTVQAALIAAREMSADITVVDTESCSMGQGFVVIAAAEAAQAGRSADEILALIEQWKTQSFVWVAVPTLSYLARSGKVTKLAAVLANLLQIKPILSMVDGAAQMVDKTRSYAKALERVLTLAEMAVGRRPARVAVLHTFAAAEAEKFRQLVEKRLVCSECWVADMGSALAVHGGQGMLGLAAFVAENNPGEG